MTRQALLGIILFFVAPSLVWGHGHLGSRIVPEIATLHAHIPNDELHFPTYRLGLQDDQGSRDKEWEVAYQKRITEQFSVSLELAFEDSLSDAEIGLIYTLWLNPSTESVGVASLGTEVEGINDHKEWALHPGFWFGKGAGNLPEPLAGLRPLFGLVAVSVDLPFEEDEASHPHPLHLTYGAHLHYSIPYLQASVADLGIPPPFSRLHPVMEFAFKKPIGGDGEDDHTDARFAPGMAWLGKYYQLSVQADIPLNDETGQGVGLIALVDIFLDDIAPRSWMGRPIF